ncbi:zinc finger protein 91-like isoform X2 [Belonocnema kinseyi]|uniref:zinc finger protein 91-like isoform X2 n=1 Tax=Belonocnema kinseyi TaxID=2817044 RepID=UPI00143DCACF|nr:zinc finger protein 91-like isoform X2 [Belonocnema kinseyi]
MNFKSFSEKSAERPDGGQHSALHSGDFLKIKTFFVKQEREDHNIFFDENQLDEKFITTEILPANNSDANNSTCMVAYDIDETLEIKQEFIQEETVTIQRYDTQYKSTFCPGEIRKHDVLFVKQLSNQKKQKILDSKQKLESKYKCEKCARSYKWKKHLNHHLRYECDVTPQFICKFCGKQFSRKFNMNTHINDLHLKTYLKPPKTEHNCDQCCRSYTAISSLNKHKRLKHAEVKPQFFCDSCDFQTKEKSYLLKHIISRHLKY